MKNLPIGQKKGQIESQLKSKIKNQLKNYLNLDARIFQILFLSLLLSFGVFLFDFSIHPLQVIFCFGVGLLTQCFFIKKYNLSKYTLLSCLISCLGISLLLRSSGLFLHPLAAFLAISSKFLITIDKQHIFNPAAFGIGVMLICSSNAWVSPGQWGSYFFLATIVLVLGLTIVTKVRQFDLSFCFLFIYGSLICLRNFYLGNPFSISLHQLASGSLLVFCFFMVSDPKTSPNHLFSKFIYTFLLSVGVILWQFYLFQNNGFIFVLLLFTPFVLILDKLFNVTNKFRWQLGSA